VAQIGSQHLLIQPALLHNLDFHPLSFPSRDHGMESAQFALGVSIFRCESEYRGLLVTALTAFASSSFVVSPPRCKMLDEYLLLMQEFFTLALVQWWVLPQSQSWHAWG